MPLYELTSDQLKKIQETKFSDVDVKECQDLTKVLRDQFEVISPDVLIIDQEFCDWEDSKRRIDLLGVDRQGNLVVVEVKRTPGGGHMELQAIRYAAMVSAMTFDRAVDIYTSYLDRMDRDEDSRSNLLEFLEWDEPDEDNFAQDVRVFLLSAGFGKEITTAVLWLNDHGLDIRCIRMKPYLDGDQVIVDIEQVIPLPEAAEYQVKMKEKVQKEKKAHGTGPDFTRYNVSVDGKSKGPLWKRGAALFVIKEICNRGVDPEDLPQIVGRKPSRLWRVVDGVVDKNEFEIRITQSCAEKGMPLNLRKWFYAEGELIHTTDKSYALTKMLGDPTWFNSMQALKSAFPQYNIEFEPVE